MLRIENLPARHKAARGVRKHSQWDAAQEQGTRIGNVQAWEQGIQHPSVDNVEAVIAYLERVERAGRAEQGDAE